jgi:hypothetical protein
MEQEWSGRLTALEAHLEGQNARLNALEQGQETLQRLALAVEVLATKQEAMAGCVEKLDEKMETIERLPAKRWEGLVDKVLMLLAGAFASFILAKGGL